MAKKNSKKNQLKVDTDNLTPLFQVDIRKLLTDEQYNLFCICIEDLAIFHKDFDVKTLYDMNIFIHFIISVLCFMHSNLNKTKILIPDERNIQDLFSDFPKVKKFYDSLISIEYAEK